MHETCPARCHSTLRGHFARGQNAGKIAESRERDVEEHFAVRTWQSRLPLTWLSQLPSEMCAEKLTRMRRTESTAMLCTPMLFVPLGFGPSPCTPSEHYACTSILQESGMVSLRRPASSFQEEQGMWPYRISECHGTLSAWVLVPICGSSAFFDAPLAETAVSTGVPTNLSPPTTRAPGPRLGARAGVEERPRR